MITIYPPRVRADASAMVVYTGTPARTVAWQLSGSGTLEPLSAYTDINGQAAALYTPGDAGETVSIEVTSGA